MSMVECGSWRSRTSIASHARSSCRTRTSEYFTSAPEGVTILPRRSRWKSSIGANARLPYFDVIFERLEHGDLEFCQVFGRHVHWGFWEDPTAADGSVEDFARAAERLCRRLLGAAGVHDGQDILDAGCGLGGTLATVNETLGSVRLQGINIDERQVDRARATVRPRAGNEIGFVHGDACHLPFDDESFDRVLAVECIFNFPSRARFLREAWRVLRPGGRLTISDFLPADPIPKVMNRSAWKSVQRVSRSYGLTTRPHTLDEYRSLARETGFEVAVVDDISEGLAPGFKVVRRLMASAGCDEFAWSTEMLEAENAAKAMRYTIMALDK